MMLSLLLACGAPEPAAAPSTPTVKPRPDIVVVLAPGLRADVPGIPGAEASFLTALGRTPDDRFSAAYSQSPTPFTAFGALLTGMYVGAIPMCALPRGTGNLELLTDRPWCASIPDARYTIPEVLALYGYHTSLVTSGFPAADVFAKEFQTSKQVDSSAELGAATLEAWGTESPRFMVVVASDLRFSARTDATQVLDGLSGTTVPPRPSMDVIHRAQAAYATAAGTFGGVIKGVLDGLEGAAGSQGLTAIVGGLTGLNLAEQGGSRDDFVPLLVEDFILDRTIHVPLFVFEPGGGETTLHNDPVELVDIFPTVTALAGVKPPADLPGADLREAPTQLAAGTGYAELGDQLALRQGTGFMLFRCYVHFCTSLDPQVTQRLVESDVSQSGGPLAYWDLMRDPLQDELSSDTRRAYGAREALLSLRQGAAAVPSDAIDAQKLWSIRMVRSQGYW